MSSAAPAAPVGEIGQASDAKQPLALTFDDGPDEEWTPLVLEQLARHRVTATFFVVGERVIAAPALVHSVLAAGHDVQLHCHRHVRHTELTQPQLERDTELALAALARVGVCPLLWRPPWGVYSEASPRVADQFGLSLVRWSIDTHDWRGDEPGAMLAELNSRLASGGSVLMHDALGPGARRRGCENTVALLAGLLEVARARGLGFEGITHGVSQVAGSLIGAPL